MTSSVNGLKAIEQARPKPNVVTFSSTTGIFAEPAVSVAGGDIGRKDERRGGGVPWHLVGVGATLDVGDDGGEDGLVDGHEDSLQA